ncbi:MAG TPA: DUF5689 domain-containing protein [Bacteroidaceae bacterium]|nr:DUF5689 domain-containing protein [Bacteroidaceae bacterium]
MRRLTNHILWGWLMAPLFVLSLMSCVDEENRDGLPQLKVEEAGTSIVFESGMSVKQSIHVTSNRAWTVQLSPADAADWVVISDMEGEGDKTISYSVVANTGEPRQAMITVYLNNLNERKGTIALTQKDADGRLYDYGNGIQSLKSLYTGSDITITDDVYVTGTIINDFDGGNNSSLKNVYISDEEAGVMLRLAYNPEFKKGDKIRVHAKGFTLTSYRGMLQLGEVTSDAIEVIANQEMPATEITSEQLLTGDYQSMYVAVSGVQATDLSKGTVYSDGTNSYNINMETPEGDKFIARFNKYTTFGQGETFPEGSGVIKGIAGAYDTDIQLFPQQAGDLAGLTGDRFVAAGNEMPTSYVSLADLRALHTGTTVTLDASYDEKGVQGVVLNNIYGTKYTTSKAFYVTDGTAGIQLYLSDYADYAIGDSLVVSLKGASIEDYSGMLELKVAPEALHKVTTVSVDPKVITVDELLTGNYQSQYVQVNDVQVASDDLSENWTYTNSSNQLSQSSIDMVTADSKTFVARLLKWDAPFAGNQVPQLSGSIKGIATQYNTTIQLAPQTEDDLAGMNQARF